MTAALDRILDLPPLASGKALRMGREALSWSQQDAADHAGLSQSMVSRIERGDAGVRPIDRRKLGAALEAYGVGFGAKSKDRNVELLTNLAFAPPVEAVGNGFRPKDPLHWPIMLGKVRGTVPASEVPRLLAEGSYRDPSAPTGASEWIIT